MRLREIEVQGHRILQPRNGAWYKTSEAVKILYDLKQKNKRIAKRVVEMWRSQTPPWIDISYQKLVEKVSKVEAMVRNTNCSVDTSIEQLIRDRVAVDVPAMSGASYLISRDKFVQEIFKLNRQEEASSKATAAVVLQNAKAHLYESRGLRAPTTAVDKRTVEKYWQHMRGQDHPIRTQVSERSHARVQAAHSEMHLLSYAFKKHIIHKPIQVLQLVLKEKYFRIMKSGEKREEFRKNTPYWRARMRDPVSGGWRDFDEVQFSCGYQKGREKFRAVCLGFEVIDRVSKKYSGGVRVNYKFKKRGYIKIKLGQIL